MAKKAKNNNTRLLSFFIILVITAAIALTVILIQKQQSINQYAATNLQGPCLPLGDVNQDSNITSVDSLLILRHVASLPISGTFNPNNADINGIGGITSVDALLIQRLVAGFNSTSWACNSVSGKVFLDSNKNQILDQGEAGYNSSGTNIVKLSRLYENIAVFSTSTDINGNYLFDKLPAGTYQITYDVSGYLPTNIPAVINVSMPPSRIINLGIRKK